jgi:hypothetical protein
MSLIAVTDARSDSWCAIELIGIYALLTAVKLLDLVNLRYVALV